MSAEGQRQRRVESFLALAEEEFSAVASPPSGEASERQVEIERLKSDVGAFLAKR